MPPTPAQLAQQPLVLSRTNAPDAADEAISIGSAALGIGQMVTAWLEAVDDAAGNPAPANCVSGNGTLTLTDRDGDHRPGAGDRITAGLSQCYVRELDDVFNGSATIDLVAASDPSVRWSGTVTFGSDFATPQGSIAIHVSGTLQFDIRSSAVSKSVRLTTSGTGLQFTASNGTQSLTEALTEMVAVREVRRDTARATSQLAYRIASEALAGAVTVSTPTPFSAWFGAYPDAGELQVTGAAGGASGVQIVAAAQGVAQADLRLAGASIGIYEMADDSTGLLWSGLGWVTLDPQFLGFGTKNADLTTFAQIGALSANTSSTHPSYAWAYSRPLAGTITGTFVRQTAGGGQPWDVSQIAAQVTQQGAYLSVQPASQLEPGASYRLDLFSNGSPANFQAADGSSLTAPSTTLAVADTIRAIAGVNGPAVLAGPGASATLDASASTANGFAVASTRWTQLSGPALSFDSTTAPVVHLTPTGNVNGVATVQVEVADANGDLDHQTLQLRVVSDTTDVLLLGLTQAAAAPVVLTSVDVPGSSATVHYYAANSALDVSLQIFGGNSYRLLSGAIGVGTYFYPSPTPGVWSTSDSAWACSNGATATGRIDVTEFLADANGNLLHLALDLQHSCQGGPTIFGSVRYNSSVPLAP